MLGRLSLLLHIASRHLVVRRRQTGVAVGGVGVGVGFFLAVSALMVGSQNDFVKTLIVGMGARRRHDVYLLPIEGSHHAVDGGNKAHVGQIAEADDLRQNPFKKAIE